MSDVAESIPSGEEVQITALLRGDERAFLDLVRSLTPAMVRVAMGHVSSKAVAEEVVQETWLAVLQGLPSFERRCPLRAWVFRILLNVARGRGGKEARSVPFTALGPAEGEAEPAVSPDRFLSGHPRWEGHWAAPPTAFTDEQLIAAEGAELIKAAIELLPETQRQVITLRDVEQWSSEEVCEALGLTEGNQRVLLHRARSKVRAALESKLHGREGGR